MILTEKVRTAIETLRRINEIGYKVQVLEDKRLARIYTKYTKMGLDYLPQEIPDRYRLRVAGRNPIKRFAYDAGANKARAIPFDVYLQKRQKKDESFFFERIGAKYLKNIQ